MDNIVAIIVALFSGGALKYFFDYLIQRRKMNQEKDIDTFTSLFKEIHKIYSILNNLQFHTGSSRVVIVKVEDSGGVPSLLTPLRSSVLYEVFNDPLPSIKSLWNGVRIGEPYIKILQELYQNGNVYYKISDIPDNSELKDVHVEKKTKYVESFFLLRDEKFFMYVSIQFSEDAVTFEQRGATYRNSVRSNIKRLKKILRDDRLIESEERFMNGDSVLGY